MSRATTIRIPVSEELARRLPTKPDEQREILELGLRERRIRAALEAYKRGEVSLGEAARRAEISLREMVPLAYAHGLAPAGDPALRSRPLTLDEASRL